MCCIMFLLPSKFEVNQLKHAQVIPSGAKRRKKAAEDEEKYFEGAYLSDDWENLE